MPAIVSKLIEGFEVAVHYDPLSSFSNLCNLWNLRLSLSSEFGLNPNSEVWESCSSL